MSEQAFIACSVADPVFGAGDSGVSRVDKVLVFLLLTVWEERETNSDYEL